MNTTEDAYVYESLRPWMGVVFRPFVRFTLRLNSKLKGGWVPTVGFRSYAFRGGRETRRLFATRLNRISLSVLNEAKMDFGKLPETPFRGLLITWFPSPMAARRFVRGVGLDHYRHAPADPCWYCFYEKVAVLADTGSRTETDAAASYVFAVAFCDLVFGNHRYASWAVRCYAKLVCMRVNWPQQPLHGALVEPIKSAIRDNLCPPLSEVLQQQHWSNPVPEEKRPSEWGYLFMYYAWSHRESNPELWKAVALIVRDPASDRAVSMIIQDCTRQDFSVLEGAFQHWIRQQTSLEAPKAEQTTVGVQEDKGGGQRSG